MIRFLLLLLPLLFSVAAYGKESALPTDRQDASRIAAVVGDSVITERDIQNRIGLLIATSNIPPRPDLAQKLFPQVIQSLIDERLYYVEAERLNIKLSDKDIRQALSVLERQNRLKEGEFIPFLQSKGIPEKEVMKQLRGQVLWNKIVTSRIRPRISVSAGEIDQAIATAKASKTGESVSFKQIYIPVTAGTPQGEIEKQKASLEKFRSEIKDCQQFDTIAKAAGSALPPELMTVPLSNLHPSLRDDISRLEVGNVSPVISSDTALQLVILCNRSSAASVADRNKVSDMLMQKKMEAEIKHYLRNLRRDTFIEIRM